MIKYNVYKKGAIGIVIKYVIHKTFFTSSVLRIRADCLCVFVTIKVNLSVTE